MGFGCTFSTEYNSQGNNDDVILCTIFRLAIFSTDGKSVVLMDVFWCMKAIIVTAKSGDGLTFRTFSKQVEGKTGQPIILNTLTIAGGCSEFLTVWAT